MKYLILSVLAALVFTASAAPAGENKRVNESWQKAIIAAIDSFPENGGYYTGRKATADFPKSAWRAMNEAFNMQLADQRPNFQAKKACPSFCSMATYAALLQAIIIWDQKGEVSRASWFNLKPLVGITDNVNQNGVNQSDGQGCWGRANANGPGIAVLVNDLKTGFSFTGFRGAKTDALKETKGEQYLSDEEWCNDPVWAKAVPGDFMKIFWDRNASKGSDSGAVIGVNANKSDEQEHGHSVIFLGYDENGDVKYWSSNGPTDTPKNAGYGIATCPRTAIQRVVFTRITNPENFDNAKKIMFNNTHKWLKSLNGEQHGTTAELKKFCGIK
ncbi:MAG: hypothetical protein ACI4AH_02950 [Muribaculaceae bacterium]